MERSTEFLFDDPISAIATEDLIAPAAAGMIAAKEENPDNQSRLPGLHIWLRGPATISNCFFRQWLRAQRQTTQFGNLAVPRDGAEVSDFNWLKKNLGSNCLIAFQSVSERLPKPALKAMKAEPGRQYGKLTSDGS
jgi:hypothetical protein